MKQTRSRSEVTWCPKLPDFTLYISKIFQMADSGMAVKDKVAFACLYLSDFDVSFMHILYVHVTDQIQRKEVLTYLSRIDLPTSISRRSPFLILGVLASIFHFYSNFNRRFCKQTVKTLMRRLVWVCAVCLFSHKKESRLVWVKLDFHGNL